MLARNETVDPTLDPARTAVMRADLLPGYELLSVVGTGGFGTIFKARQLHLDRIVALKVVDAEGDFTAVAAARFEAEALLHGKLHHPNIVEVYDSGRHGDRMFLAMELLEGEDLGRRIQREGPLPESVAWAIARQTAAALAYAASAGLVHRDIKPANIFLTPSPSWIGLPPDVPLVKVTDFGLALTRMTSGRQDTQNRGPGFLLGTPLYMAPEQFQRPEELDHRADIYALGATVYHAITGCPLFRGSGVWEILERKLGGIPAFDPSLSPESARLLAKMLAAEPRNRPGSYDELINHIDKLSPGIRALDSCREAPGGIERHSRMRRWPLLIAGATALVLAILSLNTGLWSGSRSRQPESPDVHYVSTGDHRSLFDGVSLSDWLPRTSGGVWQIAADDESEPMLTGTGFTRRLFPAIENYRLTLGVDVHSAAIVEVHFALPANAPESGGRLVLQISRGDGAVLGVRRGDKGEFRPVGQPVPFPSPAWLKDRRPYLEVRIDRTGTNWSIWFNGYPVGRSEDGGQPNAPELRISAVGGDARINSVLITTLKPQ